MRTIIIVAALTLAACEGKPGGGGGGGPDAEIACTKAVYDPCNTEHDCIGGPCHSFNADGIQVCSMACTAGSTTDCPADSTGVKPTCNAMGFCKPAAANICAIQP